MGVRSWFPIGMKLILFYIIFFYIVKWNGEILAISLFSVNFTEWGKTIIMIFCFIYDGWLEKESKCWLDDVGFL